MDPMTHAHLVPNSMCLAGHVRRAVLPLCACALSCAAQTVAVDERLLHQFGNDLGGRDWVSDLAIGPDDSTYVVGHFNTVDGEPTGSVVRFFSDGPIDPGYPAGTGYESAVTACALQDDGKLVVGGGAVFDGGDIPSLSRLTADGALDPTFDVGEGPADADGSPSIHCIAIGGPDEIYVGGRFNVWDLTNEVSCLIRVRGDGSLDSSFKPQFYREHSQIPGANDAAVQHISLYPHGRILVNGTFEQVNGEDREYIVRLNHDGTIDDTFQLGSGIQPLFATEPTIAVLDTLVTPDGKAILTGVFDAFNGTPVTGIVRLNEDGSVDPGFAPVFASPSGPFAAGGLVEVDSLGRLAIFGFFQTVNGTPRNALVRLHPDGTVDPSFNFSPSLSGAPNGLRLTSNDELVLGGSGMSLPGYPANNLFRLVPGIGIAAFEASAEGNLSLRAANPNRDILRLMASTNLQDWTPVATNDSEAADVEFAFALAGDSDPMRVFRVETIPITRFDLDNFDSATPGTAPDVGTPVGEWQFPPQYVSSNSAEPNRTWFTVAAVTEFDPSGSGNALKVDVASASSVAHLPGLLPEPIHQSSTARVQAQFDIFIPSGPHGGCFVYVGGDHGGGGYSFENDRGPQIGFSASGQVRTYHNGPNERGAYARDAWLTVVLEIDLVNDHYALSIGPRGGTLSELAAEVPFRSGTLEFIDRFTVVTFTDEPSLLAYIDNVSITALP